MIKLVSNVFTESDGQINKYWLILMGSFDSSDEIRFDGQGNYVNATTDGEVYDTIVNDNIYIEQYTTELNDNRFTFI